MSSMLRPMEQFVRTLLAARRVSTPLVSIRTADPALTVARIEEAVGKDAAIVQWDIVRGLVRVNDAGAKEIGKLLGERDSASVGPVDALVAACQLGEDAVLVFANAQRFWNDPQVAQAIWNLRDVFKANGRTLALLTTPGAVLPDELTQDVLVLDEPLPAVEDLPVFLRKRLRRRRFQNSSQTPAERPLMLCSAWPHSRQNRCWQCRCRRRGLIWNSSGNESGK